MCLPLTFIALSVAETNRHSACFCWWGHRVAERKGMQCMRSYCGRWSFMLWATWINQRCWLVSAELTAGASESMSLRSEVMVGMVASAIEWMNGIQFNHSCYLMCPCQKHNQSMLCSEVGHPLWFWFRACFLLIIAFSCFFYFLFKRVQASLVW